MIGTLSRIHKLLKITIPSSGDDLLMHKEKRSWRICIGNEALKIMANLSIPTYWLNIFTRSIIYVRMNLTVSDKWISNEEAGKYESEFHAVAGIYELFFFTWNH